MNPTQALDEIARVLRPQGWSAHVFPSHWRPIEPHIFTPLGGRFQSFPLMRLWAALGIRNGFQQGLGATEVALRNSQYAKTGINYPTAAEWLLVARPHFRAQWAERPYIEATASISRNSRAVRPLARVPGMSKIYRTLHTRVLVLDPHPNA